MKRLRIVGANWYPWPGRACDECARKQTMLHVTDFGRMICSGCCVLPDAKTEEKPNAN